MVGKIICHKTTNSRKYYSIHTKHQLGPYHCENVHAASDLVDREYLIRSTCTLHEKTFTNKYEYNNNNNKYQAYSEKDSYICVLVCVCLCL